MPALKNPRHERFAQYVAEGLLPIDAFRKMTGKKRAGDGTQSGRMLNIVGHRIAEIQAETHAETTLSIKEKRELYALIIRTPIGEIDENSILCHSVKRTTTESGGSIEYKTLDKLKATELDTALAGHIKAAEAQALTVNVGVAVNILTPERQRELAAKKRAAIERRTRPPIAITNGNGNGHHP